MKKSYKKVFQFQGVASKFIDDNQSSNTKLKNALEQALEQAVPHLEAYHKKRKQLQLKHASVDEKGNLTYRENGEYNFTKDAAIALEAELDAHLEDETLVEIDPVIIDVPHDLHRSFLPIFRGFVFEENATIPVVESKPKAK